MTVVPNPTNARRNFTHATLRLKSQARDYGSNRAIAVWRWSPRVNRKAQLRESLGTYVAGLLVKQSSRFGSIASLAEVGQEGIRLCLGISQSLGRVFGGLAVDRVAMRAGDALQLLNQLATTGVKTVLG